MAFFGLFSKEKKETLDKGLEKTKESVLSKIGRAIAGKSTVDDDVLDNLEEALITSDVGVDTTLRIIERIQERVKRDKYLGTSELQKILVEEVASLLAENNSTQVLDFTDQLPSKPYVIMVVGVNGVGKTTTIGKLAHQYKQAGKKVYLGAADTFRAAAVVQGYRSDFSDGDLHGNRFLELLDAQFLSSEEALKCGENNALNSTTLEQIPKNKVEPEAVSEELLSSILLSLFWKRRVIIRIPYVGAEAMRRSRGYLKTIYQCLPYEKRRNNGCVTGASAAMLNISKAFTIILMDGDADVSGIEFAQKIRTIEKYAFTPIIFTTSLEDPKLYAFTNKSITSSSVTFN